MPLDPPQLESATGTAEAPSRDGSASEPPDRGGGRDAPDRDRDRRDRRRDELDPRPGADRTRPPTGMPGAENVQDSQDPGPGTAGGPGLRPTPDAGVAGADGRQSAETVDDAQSGSGAGATDSGDADRDEERSNVPTSPPTGSEPSGDGGQSEPPAVGPPTPEERTDTTAVGEFARTVGEAGDTAGEAAGDAVGFVGDLAEGARQFQQRNERAKAEFLSGVRDTLGIETERGTTGRRVDVDETIEGTAVDQPDLQNRGTDAVAQVGAAGREAVDGFVGNVQSYGGPGTAGDGGGGGGGQQAVAVAGTLPATAPVAAGTALGVGLVGGGERILQEEIDQPTPAREQSELPVTDPSPPSELPVDEGRPRSELPVSEGRPQSELPVDEGRPRSELPMPEDGEPTASESGPLPGLMTSQQARQRGREIQRERQRERQEILSGPDEEVTIGGEGEDTPGTIDRTPRRRPTREDVGDTPAFERRRDRRIRGDLGEPEDRSRDEAFLRSIGKFDEPQVDDDPTPPDRQTREFPTGEGAVVGRVSPGETPTDGGNATAPEVTAEDVGPTLDGGASGGRTLPTAAPGEGDTDTDGRTGAGLDVGVRETVGGVVLTSPSESVDVGQPTRQGPSLEDVTDPSVSADTRGETDTTGDTTSTTVMGTTTIGSRSTQQTSEQMPDVRQRQRQSQRLNDQLVTEPTTTQTTQQTTQTVEQTTASSYAYGTPTGLGFGTPTGGYGFDTGGRTRPRRPRRRDPDDDPDEEPLYGFDVTERDRRVEFRFPTASELSGSLFGGDD